MAFGMNFFRKYQGRFLLIIAVFLMIVWFVGGPIARMIQPEPTAGTMFGQRVTQRTYEQTLTDLQLLRSDRRPTDEEVWRFLVMEHEADRLGIRVTQDEVLNGIRQWVQQLTRAPKENLDGAYRLVLTQLRTTDSWVKHAVARQLRIGKVRSLAGGACTITDADVWRSFVEQNATLKLKAIRVPVDRYEPEVPRPDDAVLATYYQANKPVYLIPPKAAIEYIAALKKDFDKLFPVTEDEVAAYYEEHKKEDYFKLVTRPAASTDADLRPAASTDSRLAASTDSQLSASTDSRLTADAAVSALRELASQSASSTDAQLGTVEMDYKPLSEVAGEIRQKLVSKKAKDALIDVQVDALQGKDIPLQKIAETYGLPYFTAGPFVKGDRTAIPDLADATTPEKTPVSVMEDIFNRKTGDYQSAEGPAGHFFYRITSLEPEHEPEIDTIKDRLRADYLRAEAKKLATAEAGKILEDVRANGWGNYPKDVRFEFLEASVGATGKLSDVFRAAVALKQGEFGGPVSGPDGMYDFQLVERVDPKVGDFESQKSWLKFSLFINNKYALIQDWENDLYKRADVKSHMASGGAQRPAPYQPAPLY